ncbi:MAG: ABC transporter ATP-binding protein [Deltaproteobacteria bacterium]|nr:ABC transporter ATP-binding protein [Deltaproteobacteria bacterium]
MITLKNITYKYPKKNGFALADIDFDIRPGEIFTLLGPNGSGKTTLIRIISGLILPKAGTVTICGHNIQTDEYRARKSLGLVLGDERTFYIRLSGAQNLEFFGGLYSLPRSQLKKRIMDALEMVGLEDNAKLQYMRYSTGMRKRLNMARALLHDPQVYLLDEPNSGVDPQSAKKIRDIIFSLKKQNKTILLTTHDMNEAEKMSDRIGYLKNGRLLKIGKIEEFKNIIARKSLEIVFEPPFANTEHTALNSLTAEIRQTTSCYSVEFRDNILRINYNGSFDVNKALNLISRSGLSIRKTNTREASLEDVFIKLAG